MELAIINGTYRDNSNGQKQNGMSGGTKLAAIPANIAFPLQNGQFRLPNIVPTAMPGLMNASVLRNPVRFKFGFIMWIEIPLCRFRKLILMKNQPFWAY